MTDVLNGASRRDRTDDLMITNQVLYQLSYAGLIKSVIITKKPRVWQASENVTRAAVASRRRAVPLN